MQKLKDPKFLLLFAILLIFIGSFAASLFNNSFGKVDVTRVYFDTPRGELSGLLYKPDGADDTPRPTIVATHGYLNSGEMQDAQAIEMSKRGYVVLALDQYDHGHSKHTGEKPIPFFSFWPQAIYDAVQFMYAQPFVLKDENENGIIAVTGHSMGGFSSTHAVMLDELDFAESGIRKIFASLPVGSDYQWVKVLGFTDEDINNSYGPRFAGNIAAQYDEFFFNAEAAAAGKSVVKKDYVATEEGKGFLGNPETATAGEVYDVNGGKRIVYQPNETHPWNHFSKTSTGHAIDFYDMAFADYGDVVKVGEDGQSWMWKEWFSFVALVGFFLLFLPLIMLLAKVPFFQKAFTEKPKALSEPKTNGAKLARLLLLVFGGLYPALFFSALYSGDESGMRLLLQASVIVFVLALGVLIRTYVKPMEQKIRTCASIMVVLSVVQFFYLKNQATFLETTAFFGAPTVNPIAYWAINVAIVTLMIMVCYHFVSKKANGATIKNYGVKTSLQSVVASLGLAVSALVVGYALLFLVDAVFKTDFRLWTLAVKTFEVHHVVAVLKYAPLFFLYYFVVGLSINMNTSGEKYNGAKGYVVAALHFIGGLLLYLGYHYGLLFTTGTAGYPGESLSSIIVIGLVPVLLVASIINRYFYLKTGNVYVGTFVNTLLMTTITVANTTLYTVF